MPLLFSIIVNTKEVLEQDKYNKKEEGDSEEGKHLELEFYWKWELMKEGIIMKRNPSLAQKVENKYTFHVVIGITK